MHATIRFEGFVLKRKVLLDKDIFLTVFTKELGKIVLVAKGARTLTSRRAAHLQTGNLIKGNISSSHDRYFLQSTDLISGFLQLRTTPHIDYIYSFLAVIDRLIPEGEPELEIFTILKRYFIRLSRDEDPSEILRSSLRDVLKLLGYVDAQESLAELIDIAEENMGMKLPPHVIM